MSENRCDTSFVENIKRCHEAGEHFHVATKELIPNDGDSDDDSGKWSLPSDSDSECIKHVFNFNE
jgi:hypothetical protein